MLIKRLFEVRTLFGLVRLLAQVAFPQLSMHGSTIFDSTLFRFGYSLPGGFCEQQATFRSTAHSLGRRV
jgi:hypothetical protein